MTIITLHRAHCECDGRKFASLPEVVEYLAAAQTDRQTN